MVRKPDGTIPATRKPKHQESIMSGGSLIIKDEFATKYDYAHALRYYNKHHHNLCRQISNYREKNLARAALSMAGSPETILDLPCGTGRFWPVLASTGTAKIIAADSSSGMLKVAEERCPPELISKITLLHTSAYNIALDNNSVDLVFCMRLLHHNIGSQEKRRRILAEFRRVTRQYVIFSLWVDGNFKAWRRRERDRREIILDIQRPANRFICPRRIIENECHQAGFEIVRYFDLFRYYSMWRFYLLKKQAVPAENR